MKQEYRAKTKTGKWITGQYIYAEAHDKHYISTGTVHETAFHGGETLSHDLGQFVEVDPKTVCRPIGVKDNEGGDRWEHDIIRDGPRTYEIRWNEKAAYFYLYGLGPTFCIHPDVPWHNLPKASGNTIDNLELLEGDRG